MRFLNHFAPPILILAFGVGGFFLLSFLKADVPTKPPGSNIPKVNVEPIDHNVGMIDIQVNGTVMPKREIRITAEVAGRITQKLEGIRAGRFIEANTELCQIDSEPYELELQRLANELAQVDVDLRQLDLEEKNTDALIALAQEDVERAERELARQEEARRKSTIANVVTDAQLDAAQGEITRTKNTLQTLQNTKNLIPTRRERLEAQKSLTETRKQIAQLDKDRTIVSAPISGVISSESIEQGDFTQRGTELLVLEDVSQMEVSCRLLTEDLYWIWAMSQDAGQSGSQNGAQMYYDVSNIDATITLAVGEQKFEWGGKLSRLEGSALHEGTRTVPCRVTCGQPKSRNGGVAPPSLAKGMFVSVTLHVPPTSTMVRIPEQALRMNGRIYTTTDSASSIPQGVSLSEGQAVLNIHTVTIARSVPGAVIVQMDSIQPPLPPGARLVTSPMQFATQDMIVEIEPLTAGEAQNDGAPGD
ncbi:MAG: HlyD family efflux transporter periplasmic adaptor subunit [Pirellulales bacterium]|nr:HlyD family efflux transporter periplasmic adaptor subunit [Pirellulales bacterium]